MKKTILLVEDEPDIRFAIRTLLSRENFIIKEAKDGLEALERLKAQNFNLMILDLMMPRMSGYELLELLPRNYFDHMPLIILTAKGDDMDVLQGYSMGATYYITKPFEGKTLKNIINYLLGNLSPREMEKIEQTL